MPDKEIGKKVEDFIRSETTVDLDRQALARELVDHRQHPEGSPVMGPALDEVIGPVVVPPAWPQPDAGPVIERTRS